MQNLFQLGRYVLSSGAPSYYKIECEALTEDDWTCLAFLVAQRVPSFREVIGVPRGGIPLAEKLTRYVSPTGIRLVVDDVLTTGNSMKKIMQPDDYGYVIFAREKPPANIGCLFQLDAL